MEHPWSILLTGATGYIGSKLLTRLEQAGHSINCLARDPSRVCAQSPSTRVFRGNVLECGSLSEAFEGCKVAYYLIHALQEKKNFEIHELQGAENFACMARAAGVEKIIYLGGLGNESETLSAHLQSRHDVGHLLRHSGIPTIELQASIVLGKGSLSYEMIRSLTEHLPVMIMPRWVSVKAQPIGIRDLLDYLEQSLELTLKQSTVVEIGGADQVSYRELMTEYAKQRNLQRLMIPVPVLTPWLSSRWLSLVTPLYAIVGRKLIEGIRNPTIVINTEGQKLFNVHPIGASEAISECLSPPASTQQTLENKKPKLKQTLINT